MEKSTQPPRVLKLSALFCCIFLSGGCGSKGGGGVVRAILCGSGHTKGLMSVGVDPTVLQSLGVPSSNAGLRETINTLIAKSGVESSLINVKKVESVDKGDSDSSENSDKVRFLELGGDLGGLGIATKYLFDAAAQLGRGGNLAAGQSLFTFARESFKTGIASPVPNAFTDFLHIQSNPQLRLLTNYTANPKQWALAQTDFQGAIQKLLANAKTKVTVAVVDTGIDLNHPDLKDIISSKQANFVDPSSPPQDGNGHGTHCAGIIASQGKNGGPVGVAAPLASKGLIEIMPVKVLADNGSGDSQAVEKGVRWAVKNGAKVISMSLGGGRDWSDAKQEGLVDQVIKDAVDAGAIVIVAAGNENCPLGGECQGSGLFSASFKEYIVHPCSYENTICVGATNADETLAPYSNYSSKKTGAVYRTAADVNAPGTNIYSTWPVSLSQGEPYKAISGTSMATPYIAGVAALILANNPQAKWTDVKAMLQAAQAYPSQIKEKSDQGRVDLAAVASKVAGETAPPPSAKPVEDPNKPEGGGGEPLGLSTLWQAVCAQ